MKIYLGSNEITLAMLNDLQITRILIGEQELWILE